MWATINLMLCLGAFGAAAQTPETQVERKLRQWERGQRIEVTYVSGEKVLGRLGEVRTSDFTLEGDKKAQPSRDLRFDRIQSVSSKWTKKRKWMIAGLIYGGFVAVGSLVEH